MFHLKHFCYYLFFIILFVILQLKLNFYFKLHYLLINYILVNQIKRTFQVKMCKYRKNIFFLINFKLLHKLLKFKTLNGYF